MGIFAGAIIAEGNDMMYHWEDRLADDIGFAIDGLEFEQGRIGLCGDLIGRPIRNDAKARLNPRQRRLDVEIALDRGGLGKDVAHGGSAEQILEQAGVDDTGWYWGFLRTIAVGERGG